LNVGRSVMGNALSSTDYVRQVLAAWRRTPGTTGAVRPNDRLFAAALYDRGVPLTAVQNAMILAAARRICRPPGLAPLQPMRSLHYLQPVIDEVLQLGASADFFRYLQSHIDRALDSQRPR
jgi:hypothetical protein